MRIALTNSSNRLVGGVETYLADIAEYLAQKGHQLSILHQSSEPKDRLPIPIASSMPSWDVSALGLEDAMENLAKWRPEIIYSHGHLDPKIELRVADVAPVVYFAHDYHGLCISGGKATHLPILEPCLRRFGSSCLLHFYPRRCGGLNPWTMVQDFRLNQGRLAILRRYPAVVTHSSQIAREYREQGVPCDQVRFTVGTTTSPQERQWVPDSRWRLLMMGRMYQTKGGQVLLDALPLVREQVRKPITLTMAGDGPSRKSWEAKAREITQKWPDINVTFSGWLSAGRRAAALAECDVITVPSLWPEPFGLTGPEAGLYGAPAVSFRTGGIPDWLTDGVNGCMAPADPPSARGFAEALARCLSDEDHYRRLRTGARKAATSLNLDTHYKDLMTVFNRVLERVQKPQVLPL